MKKIAKLRKRDEIKSPHNAKLNLLAQSLGSERIKFDEIIASYTYPNIGGPAECFYIATNALEFEKILGLCEELKIPYFILGSGTKSIISDNGIKGLVIKNRTGSIKIIGVKGKVGRSGIGVDEATLEVDSGVTIAKLNDFLQNQNLQTIDGISSKFSTIGGSIFIDPILREKIEKIVVWDKGEKYIIDLHSLKRVQYVVLQVVFRIRSIN